MSPKKRVLVCGASGFLGKNIFECLSRRNDLEVKGTYLVNRYGRIDPNDPRFSKVDLTKEEEAHKAIRDIDVVVQMAASSTGAKDVKERPYIQVTPNAVANSWIFQAAFDNNVPQVIFPSCTVMYDDSDTGQKETDLDLNKISPEKVYYGAAKMKTYVESQCQFFAGLGRTRFTAIRHSNIYGPHDRFDPQRSHVFGANIRKVVESRDGKVVVWGQGKEVRDFLYIDDFVRFIEKVVDQQDYKFDVFNLGSDQPITIAELVQRMIRISGRDLEIVYNPEGPTIGTKTSINSSKAREKFNWQPKVSLDDGIAQTIDWYRKNLAR